MSVQDVLVLAEIQRNALTDVTLELLAAARGLAAATGGEVVALVLGQDGARSRRRSRAADRIVIVDASAVGRLFARALPGRRAGRDHAAEKPRAVLIAGTSIGWDLAPMLSARLDGAAW